MRRKNKDPQQLLNIENTDTDIPFDTQNSLLENLLNNGIEIDHSCGGMGVCGTCKIYVTAGLEQLPPRNEEESDRAHDLGFSENERLSCQIHPCSGLKIRLP